MFVTSSLLTRVWLPLPSSRWSRLRWLLPAPSIRALCGTPLRSDSMAENEQLESEPQRTHAAVRRSRWPGWIWAVPVAALGVLIWLGVRFFFTHGADVTVIFDKATGVNAQATRVNFRGVDIGGVS